MVAAGVRRFRAHMALRAPGLISPAVTGVAADTRREGRQYGGAPPACPQGVRRGQSHASTQRSRYQRRRSESGAPPRNVPPRRLYSRTSWPDAYADGHAATRALTVRLARRHSAGSVGVGMSLL